MICVAVDYDAPYVRVIERARARATSRVQAKKLLGYNERHRIVPGCLGGQYVPENIAYLTGREHYVAHQLLVKMYPKNAKLAVAAIRMARQSAGARSYEWLRKRRSELMRGHPLYGPSKKGVPKTPEHAINVGNAKRGISWGKHTDKARAKMSASHKGKPHSPEHLANLRAALKVKMAGNKHGLGVKHPTRSEEWRAKQSTAQRRRFQKESVECPQL